MFRDITKRERVVNYLIFIFFIIFRIVVYLYICFLIVIELDRDRKSDREIER